MDALDEARGWLADCGDDDAYERSAREVFAMIERNYDGGWENFVLAVA